MEDYDAKPNFASFLPGVAGIYGKPLWAFYTNRAQGIASFGLVSKQTPIMEFNAANKAYQDTPALGFRTFITATRDGKTSGAIEPFSPMTTRNLAVGEDSKDPKRFMFIDSNEFEVRDIDKENGLSTTVSYIILPEEDFGALVRRTTISNIEDTPVTISVLDGLAKLEPVGGDIDWGLKNMGRTLEGWMGVYQADPDSITMPFYRMSTEPSDSASVRIEEAGHFLISMIESTTELLPIIYDTNQVFGQDSSLTYPLGLQSKSVEEMITSPQYGQARTSSGFAALKKTVLKPGESITIASFYGKLDHVDEVPPIAKYVATPGYVAKKYAEARTMMDKLTAGVETNTTQRLFDGAVKQMYLDNSLRGGMPHVFGDVDEKALYSTYDDDDRVKVFHTFSRIHGDLERDYNAFNIAYTYFSQGPGNFRDVAQNRRDDVTFTPRMGSFDVQEFLSYIQANGYEPLTVEAVVYYVMDDETAWEVGSNTTCDYKSSEVLHNILVGGPFRPGQLFDLIEKLDVKICVEKSAFVDQVLASSQDIAMGVFGQGYWADHWEYYLDLIHAYLAIYPDGEEKLMYDRSLRYFFSTAIIKPRSEKYVVTLTYDGQSKHILQLDATDFSTEKVEEQNRFRSTKTGVLSTDAYWQRTPDGGEAFRSSPIAKLFLLGAIKYATRDAWGMGIEYEGGRPGWNDAMNGLPGMVGSGMPETFELHQLLKYVKKVVGKYQRPVVVPAELKTLVDEVNAALVNLKQTYTDPEELPFEVPQQMFDYWNIVATAREEYRKKTCFYFSGQTASLTPDDVVGMIDEWLDQIEIGMERAIQFGSHGFEDDG